jgi:GxxExxY protein
MEEKEVFPLSFILFPLKSVLIRVIRGQISFFLLFEGEGHVLVHENDTYDILGACFAVYNTMGSGFLEAVYQECLGVEFRYRGISQEAQHRIGLRYKGQKLEQFYIADFVVNGSVIVEIKAVSELAAEHKAQLLNYLHATRFDVGLLVNFGHYPKLEYQRMVL